MSHLLDDPEVSALEAQVDAYYAQVALPPAVLPLSLWHLLTVGEDSTRTFLLGISMRKDMNELEVLHQTIIWTNQVKFGIRHGIDRLTREKEPAELRFQTPRIDDKVATTAQSLLHAGVDYDVAYRLFSAYWARQYKCSFDEDRKVYTFDSLTQDRGRYAALYFLLGSEQTGMTPIALFLMLSQSPGRHPDVVRQIAGRTAPLSRDGVGYHFDPRLARALQTYLHDFPRPTSGLPTSWEFPWGQQSDVIAVFEALQLRSLYHLLSIHFGALKLRTRGWGVQSLILLTDRAKLIGELQMICSAPATVVEAVADALTFGKNTTSPDPALQPLIPADQSRIYVPGIEFISSNYERNLLVLHNRTNRKSFDSQSSAFETQMMGVLGTGIRSKFKFVLSNCYVPGLPDEIDLLIADPSTRTILVVEAKWMLEPADAKEVIVRVRELHRKIEQVDLRVRYIRSNLETGLGVFGLAARNERKIADWAVFGIVVVDGYTGMSAGMDRGIPAVPQDVFLAGLGMSRDLRHFSDGLLRGAWLPVEGVHYLLDYAETTFGDVTLRWPSLSLPHESRFRDHLMNSFGG